MEPRHVGFWEHEHQHTHHLLYSFSLCIQFLELIFQSFKELKGIGIVWVSNHVKVVVVQF
ncbi:hypothetical protein C5167_025891 [Papaver somniferum]|uniref:Uncharacterized protein n=1 Tax=Papaver somniferum TaxID=3469 RepID=A0A4Y7JWL9_PAPSO|nr:hypothetical protein C5167_025891 [Papaver somniferum]